MHHVPHYIDIIHVPVAIDFHMRASVDARVFGTAAICRNNTENYVKRWVTAAQKKACMKMA